MTIKEARQRLAQAGIGLGTVQRRSNAGGGSNTGRSTISRCETIYPIITPVGNTMEFQAHEMVALLRDLARASANC